MDRVLFSVTCHGHCYVQVIKVLRKWVYIVHCWNTQMSESDCASKLRQISCCKQTDSNAHRSFKHSSAAQWLNRTYCQPKWSDACGIISRQRIDVLTSPALGTNEKSSAASRTIDTLVYYHKYVLTSGNFMDLTQGLTKNKTKQKTEKKLPFSISKYFFFIFSSQSIYQEPCQLIPPFIGNKKTTV